MRFDCPRALKRYFDHGFGSCIGDSCCSCICPVDCAARAGIAELLTKLMPGSRLRFSSSIEIIDIPRLLNDCAAHIRPA